ncbi:MAG: glycoside hydrolase family protein [Christensenellales bacterium]|jgi:hypothetical protein
MKAFDIVSHMLPLNPKDGLSMPDRWVWCGSSIRGEDGKYHLFAAAWSKERPFFSGYVFSSEIIRAVSDTPYGPFTYQETILPDRGANFWDGRMTHNPTIHKFRDTYYLFYIGATYAGERPDGETLRSERHPLQDIVYATIRIGLATSKSVYGPWERRDQPILDVTPDAWDCLVVTNPAACFLEDGTILLYYRSNTPGGLRIGLAKGHVSTLTFEKVAGPLWPEHPDWILEDHFVWHNGENLEMIAKDIEGSITGIRWGGAHLVSQDGIHWDKAQNPIAYTRTFQYDDGYSETFYHFERPCLLIEDGKPVCMYAALGTAGEKTMPHESENFAQMICSKNQTVRFR